MPVVPAVRQDNGDDGDNLDDGLEFAEVAGFNGEAFGAGDAAQSAHQKLAANHQYRDPGLHDVRRVLHQANEGRRDQQLVGQRIEQHSNGRNLAAPPREVAVYAVRDGNQNEEERGEQLLLPVRSPKREVRRQHPDKERHAQDASHRNGVGKVHGTARGEKRVLLQLCTTIRGNSHPQSEAEAHIFAIPHDVVRSPGIVVQAAMDAPGKIGLRAGEVQR